MTVQPAHLVARFFGSLLPRRVSVEDRAWVASRLDPPERALWETMPRADQVESVGVGRRAEAALARDLAQRDDYVAAALLHDVGKVAAAFGPFRRSLATMLGAVGGGRRAVGDTGGRNGFARRCALYLDHAAIGADRIQANGGRTAAAQWAAVHHDPAAWAATGIPLDVCRTLARADGERVC